MNFIALLQAAGEGAPSASSSMGFISTVLPFLLIIFIFYFFLIRPQSKKQKETQKMIDALKKGDKVITIGGIHGTVVTAKEKTIIVKVDDNCKMEFTRSAIAGLDNPPPATDSKAKAPSKKEKADKAEKSDSPDAKIDSKDSKENSVASAESTSDKNDNNDSKKEDKSNE